MGYEDINQKRSSFWIRVYENDDSLTFLTNEHTYNLIDIFYPEIEELSPKNWSRTSTGNYSLWIPEDRIEQDIIEDFIGWAKNANQHIWLQLNKNIEDYFSDELNFCLAYDWNIDFSTGNRTTVGEAEYQIKYRYSNGHITKKDADSYAEVLSDALLCCCKYLPIQSKDNLLVTTIPATVENQNKLSWGMAHYIQREYGGHFLAATLHKQKPQIKALDVEKRIETWEEIYEQDRVDLSISVAGKTVLIVDDLYQSGATMWHYARYLKNVGAQKVVGLVSVKAQKDRGNI